VAAEPRAGPVPLPCHSQRSRAVPSGHPRIIPRPPWPAPFPAFTSNGTSDLALQAGGQRGLSRPSNRTALRAFSRLLKVVFWQIFWQAPLRARSRRLFALVGVTGIEPVTSAV
jgi:hypothetical protein